MNKIFYGKEPNQHQFFVDWDKKRFYKRYTLEYIKAFEREVSIYTALKNCPYVAKLISHSVNHSFATLELELIPHPPITGYGKAYLPWKDATYSAEQKSLIVSQFTEVCDFIEKAGLVKDGEIDFELTQNNIIFDPEIGQIRVFDFAPARCAYPFIKNFVLSEIASCVKIGNPFTYKLSQKDLDFLVFPDAYKTNTSDKLLSIGNSIIEKIKEFGPRYVYQSLYINGVLQNGQRDFVEERMEIFNISEKGVFGKTCVDIGCNVGGLSTYLVERGAAKVIGVEACPKAAAVAKLYLDYLTLINPLYSKVAYNHADAVTFNFPDADVLFYCSVWRHFGSAAYHKMLGSKFKTIYFEGHAYWEEKDLVETKVLSQFGPGWKWEYLGSVKEGVGADDLKRPVFRGTML